MMDHQQSNELTLSALLDILRRHRNVILGVTLFCLGIAIVYCTLTTREYEAKGIVQVQRQSADGLGLDTLMNNAGGSGMDALTANIDIQTQAKILESDSLSIQTISQLDLEKTPDFRSRWSLGRWASRFLPSNSEAESPLIPIEATSHRRQTAVTTFKKRLSVKPVGGTRLIEIAYSSSDPKLAAAVVNTLSKALAEYTFQTRYDATKQASKWLGEQLTGLRKESEALQGKVVQLQRESGVYSVGTTDAQGREQAYSSVLEALQEATQAVSIAEQSRIIKGAISEAASSGDAEMLSGLAGNMVGPGSQPLSNSLSLLQSLRQQEAVQRAALQEAEVKYSPAFPKLEEMRGNLSGLQGAISDETERIRRRAANDYKVAQQTELSTRKQYDVVKQRADTLNDKAIEYAIVREEADQSRSLYQDLLKRLNEAGVLEGLKSSNITVVDPGRVPDKPIFPNVPLYILASMFGGCFIGCCIALLLNALDNKINGIHDVELLFQDAVLGALPFAKIPARGDDKERHILLALDQPQSPFVEALRAVITALMLSRSEMPPQVILVTSSIAGEGKTTCAANLAVLFAQSGRKTLLVDTDLRKGTLRRKLSLDSGHGLSEAITGRGSAQGIQVIEAIPNLFVLPAGQTPPNPSDLLNSKTLASMLLLWREQYDVIILDSAPVLPVTDSVPLSALVDASVLLVRSALTLKAQGQRSYRLLRQNERHYVGVVLNRLSSQDSSYYGYYGYRGYGKSAYPQREETHA